jgi:hypothetical protein
MGLDTTVVEVSYLIDAALLKAHVSSGVSLYAKNLFGTTSIYTDWYRTGNDGFPHNRDGSPSYAACVDFLGYKDIGGKTMLLLIDGSMEAKMRMVRRYASGRWRPSMMRGEQHLHVAGRRGRRFSGLRFFSLRNGPISWISRMQATTSAKRQLQTIRLRRRSTIQNAMAYDAAASGRVSIGTMERTRSTRAISEKRTGSTFSRCADRVEER